MCDLRASSQFLSPRLAFWLSTDETDESGWGAGEGVGAAKDCRDVACGIAEWQSGFAASNFGNSICDNEWPCRMCLRVFCVANPMSRDLIGNSDYGMKF